MNALLTGRYLFPVRPRHLETFDSYSGRLLAENFETEEHRRALSRAASIDRPGTRAEELWTEIVQVKAGRPVTHLVSPKSSSSRHADGSTCDQCLLGSGGRYLCRLCARGDEVAQHAHFGTNVCLRHRLWVGPGARPDAQTSVGNDQVVAELRFRKMVRRGVMDSPLYLRLRRAIVGISQTEGAPASDARNYPTIAQVAVLITSVTFGQRFFNPANSFATAYEYLLTLLAGVLERGHETVARDLWLYFRPTFLNIRESVESGEPYRSASPHDFPLRAAILTSFNSPMRPLEPFIRYLKATGDDRITNLNYEDVLTHYGRPTTAHDSATGARPMICRLGHRTVAASLLSRSRERQIRDNCAVCENRELLVGFNDAATTHPFLEAELDPAKNNGLSARDIFAGSPKTYTWTCHQTQLPHDFAATASNRTANGTHCPVCLNRDIRLGINDLGTLHPAIWEEFDPTANPGLSILQLAPGSNTLVAWKCTAARHPFTMTVGQRTRGASCPTCPNDGKVERTLAFARPDLAAELHPTKNAPRTANDIPIGSHLLCYWVCPMKHTYEQIPERRNAGYGCPTCSRRRFVKGVNDPATLHAEICGEWHTWKNGTLVPTDKAARTRHIWWTCKANGHVTEQTLAHRILSKGCTDCDKSERIMADPQK
jgi:hypothetical protein